MKVKSIIMGGLLIVFGLASGSTFAQSADPAVKILPSSQKGIIKVLYAYETDQPVYVKFYNENGLITLDRIRSPKGLHGFSKKYDVRHISGPFRVEVTSAAIQVTYSVTESSDGRFFVPVLEKAAFSYPLVARVD